MKKLFNLIIALTITITCGAQTINVHMKNGKVIQLNASEVKHFGFTAATPEPTYSDEEIAWRWITHLTNVVTKEENWENKTYKPTIGKESDSNSLTRLVIVNNLDEAKAHFANIVGCKVSDLTRNKLFDAGQYGSIEWNVTGYNGLFATVEVYMFSIPHLETIEYCTEDYASY